MKISEFLIIEENEFSNYLKEWSEKINIPVQVVESKDDELHEKLQGVVIFHENHDISKDAEEISKQLDSSNIPTHKVDINGTLTATVNNLNMWIDRNKCEKILILAEPELAKNENIGQFLEKLVASYNS